MYKVNAMIPLNNEVNRLPDEIYKAIEKNNSHLGIIREIKRGRGTKKEFLPLDCDTTIAIKGPAIMLASKLYSISETTFKDYPYIRLISNLINNELEVNFIFSKDAGNLPSPNYTWVKD